MLAKVMRVSKTPAVNRYDLYHYQTASREEQSSSKQKQGKAEGFEAALQKSIAKKPGTGPATISAAYELDLNRLPF